jgi:hydrogenase 3 maturation protease
MSTVPGDREKVRQELIRRLGRTDPHRIVLVGIGNRMRGDDAIGPLLLDALRGAPVHLIDARVVPEEYTSLIKRLNPEVIAFIDALDHGGTPGSIAIIGSEEVFPGRESSHTLSLDLIMDYLRQETGAEVFLIGIQHREIRPDPGLSPGMEASIQAAADLITASLQECPGDPEDPASPFHPHQDPGEREYSDQTDRDTA